MNVVFERPGYGAYDWKHTVMEQEYLPTEWWNLLAVYLFTEIYKD